MAMIPMQYGRGAVKYEVIASAAANQTWGTQITKLKTTFDSLTDDEKAVSILIHNDSVIYGISNIPNGVYTRIFNNQGATDCRSVYMYTQKYWNGSNDQSNVTDTSKLELAILKSA